MRGIMNHSIDGTPELEPVLVTERTVLRAACDLDIPALHGEIFSVPEVMRYVFAGVPLSGGESEKLIRQHFNFGKGKTGLSVLADKASGDVLGFAGLHPCDVFGGNDFEIGFVLAKKAWGKGLAREIGARDWRSATGARVSEAEMQSSPCSSLSREHAVVTDDRNTGHAPPDRCRDSRSGPPPGLFLSETEWAGRNTAEFA